MADGLGGTDEIPVARTLVERGDRMLAAHHFVNCIELQSADPILELVASAHLGRLFTGNADGTRRNDQDIAIAERRDRLLAGAVGLPSCNS